MICAQPKCRRQALTGCYLCARHERQYATAVPVDHDYEAARIDPTTDRDRWDVWGEDGAA